MTRRKRYMPTPHFYDRPRRLDVAHELLQIEKRLEALVEEVHMLAYAHHEQTFVVTPKMLREAAFIAQLMASNPDESSTDLCQEFFGGFTRGTDIGVPAGYMVMQRRGLDARNEETEAEAEAMIRCGGWP